MPGGFIHNEVLQTPDFAILSPDLVVANSLRAPQMRVFLGVHGEFPSNRSGDQRKLQIAAVFPVARPSVVLAHRDFLLPGNWLLRIDVWAMPHLVSGQAGSEDLVLPIGLFNRGYRDDRIAPGEPTSHSDDQISDPPRLVVKKEITNFPNLAVRRVHGDIHHIFQATKHVSPIGSRSTITACSP